METTTTFLRGIFGIDLDHRDTGQACLVCDAPPYVVKAPVVQSPALLASGLNPAADALECFESDSPTVALRCSDDLFRDTVILVLLKSGLLATNLTQFALSRSCAFALEVAPAVRVFAPDFINRTAAITVAFAIDSQIDHAEVNAEDASHTDFFGIRNVAHAGNVPMSLDIHKVNLALTVSQQSPLPLPALIRNGQASSERPDRDVGIGAKAEDAFVVGLRGMLTKAPSCLSVEFVGIGDLGNATHDYLSREAEAFTTRSIGEIVQLELTEDFSLPSLSRQPRTGSVSRLKGVKQGFVLFGSRAKFDVGDKFHSSRIEEFCVQHNKTLALPVNFRFLCSLKEAVSTKRIL